MRFLLTYLHFFSFISLVALLAVEFFLLRTVITQEKLYLLKKIDLSYGLAAIAVSVTGLFRIFYEKGLDYYLYNFVFWGKISLFVVVGALSLYPTIFLLKTKAVQNINVMHYNRTKQFILLQLVLVPMIVFMAIWMARGLG